MINRIKNFIREYFPKSFYTSIFIVYKKIIRRGQLTERDIKFSNFRKAGFYDFTLDNISFPIFLNPENGGVDYEIFADGAYESDLLRLIKTNLNTESIFLDIGANIGQHSMYASHFCKKVFSFEPIKKLYIQMSDSVYMNDMFNIQIMNYGLGDSKSISSIYSSNVNVGNSSLIYSRNKKKVQDVKIVKLDDIYRSLDINRCDLIKIDVEGFEYHVLLGAKDFILKFKPKIILEYSPVFYRNFDPQIAMNILTFLKGIGYSLYDVGSGDQMVLVDNFDKYLNQDQTNLFCVPSHHLS